MNSLIRPYVLPIFRRAGDERSFAGTGFCVDGLLVTASHVLTDEAPYYVRNGSTYHPLQYQLWHPRQVFAADRMGFDVAFYPLPGLKSPLSLAGEDAEKGDELEILCWQMTGGVLRQVGTRGLVTDSADEDGYLKIATVNRITHGCSGCPVFRDGKVYGIITMGRDWVDAKGMSPLGRQMEENMCWIFKVGHIRRFLR